LKATGRGSSSKSRSIGGVTAPSCNGFPATARDAFDLYYGLGVRTVPVLHRSKNPGLAGWPDLRLTPADRDEHFPAGEDRNIGALLGPVSGNLADIDLDCAEAVKAARVLLPPTGWIFGRAGRRGSHYLYSVKGELKSDEFKGTDRKKVVELRYSRQTIFPPSVHEDTGQLIEWECFAERAEIAADALIAAVKAYCFKHAVAERPVLDYLIRTLQKSFLDPGNLARLAAGPLDLGLAQQVDDRLGRVVPLAHRLPALKSVQTAPFSPGRRTRFRGQGQFRPAPGRRAGETSAGDPYNYCTVLFSIPRS
jgi:hypothetical protein